MYKIEPHLLLKLKKRKKLFKVEANHRLMYSHHKKSKKKKNQTQKVNLMFKNKKFSLKWNIEEKYKKIQLMHNKNIRNHKNLKLKKKKLFHKNKNIK
jgi:hypothetical protein